MLAPGATPADVVEAAGVIEDAGFTTVDDLLHVTSTGCERLHTFARGLGRIA